MKNNKTLGDICKAILSRFFATELYKMHYLRLKINIDFINEKLAVFDLDVNPLTLDMVKHGDSNIFKGEKF